MFLRDSRGLLYSITLFRDAVFFSHKCFSLHLERSPVQILRLEIINSLGSQIAAVSTQRLNTLERTGSGEGEEVTTGTYKHGPTHTIDSQTSLSLSLAPFNAGHPRSPNTGVWEGPVSLSPNEGNELYRYIF